jgi:putative ABC transport system permease protein
VRLKEGQLKQGIDHIEQVLRRRRNVRYNQPNDFELETADSFVRTFDDITRAAFGVMLIISSVAFLVGGIGVTNIMLVAVTERTREIGIRKAIGARRRDIIWQFLTEAMTLTGIGGLLGVGVASGVALLIQKLVPQLSMDIPLWAVFFGVTGSVSVGLVFGMWPALRAARLDPIVALRYE